MSHFFRSVVAAALCTALLAPAQAGTLAPPKGAVVLTVTGKIATTNVGATAQFDLGQLSALPGRVTETETPWTKGKTRFEGPLGSALLDAVGASGESLHVVALNDYAVDVPVEDFRKWPVILAVKKDGKPMSVRDKGPIFVIYPFDVDPSLYNERTFSRSAWQVKSIEVR
ncbi:MAG: hypothetical protein LWW93_10570 [Hyphomicrobiales bacterium]|nr:hypothetical protein [Hyphomicrobiales bacterium]